MKFSENLAETTDFTKLSSLTRFVVASVIAAEEDPRFEINMGVYHDWEGDVCIACPSGLASISRWNNSYPIKANCQDGAADDIKVDFYELLDFETAVDALCLGEVLFASFRLDLDIDTHKLNDYAILDYSVDPGQWKADMINMAESLEDSGY